MQYTATNSALLHGYSASFLITGYIRIKVLTNTLFRNPITVIKASYYNYNLCCKLVIPTTHLTSKYGASENPTMP